MIAVGIGVARAAEERWMDLWRKQVLRQSAVTELVVDEDGHSIRGGVRQERCRVP